MMYGLRCNADGARPIKVILGDKTQGLEQSTSLKCTCDYHNLNKGKYTVNTTIIKNKRCPDSVIDPKTSGFPGSVLAFTPPGHLRNLKI